VRTGPRDLRTRAAHRMPRMRQRELDVAIRTIFSTHWNALLTNRTADSATNESVFLPGAFATSKASSMVLGIGSLAGHANRVVSRETLIAVAGWTRCGCEFSSMTPRMSSTPQSATIGVGHCKGSAARPHQLRRRWECRVLAGRGQVPDRAFSRFKVSLMASCSPHPPNLRIWLSAVESDARAFNSRRRRSHQSPRFPRCA
jgi:hypothetical protein